MKKNEPLGKQNIDGMTTKIDPKEIGWRVWNELF
jgi:hypothetical protein